MSSNQNIKYGAAFTGIFVVLVIVLGFFLASQVGTDTPTASSDTTSSTTAPRVVDTGVNLPVIDLEGKWVAKENGRQFAATVQDGTISINLENDSVSMLYWTGTFDTANTSGAIILSDKIEVSLAVLSQADSKEFVFENDKLSFTFEAIGMKTTVVMNRV
jgi:hypothetical protein